MVPREQQWQLGTARDGANAGGGAFQALFGPALQRGSPFMDGQENPCKDAGGEVVDRAKCNEP